MYGINSIKEFKVVLDKSENETLLHKRFEFDSNKKLVKFTLNMTIITSEEEIEIVRFDCAHGYLHMHRFYRRPPTKETIHYEISKEIVRKLTQEIKENKKNWKEAFIANYGGLR